MIASYIINANSIIIQIIYRPRSYDVGTKQYKNIKILQQYIIRHYLKKMFYIYIGTYFIGDITDRLIYYVGKVRSPLRSRNSRIFAM